MSDEVPKFVVLISGKRKSGKDHIAEMIVERCNYQLSTIVRISEPIKTYYANKYNLNISELLSDGKYKEKHRRDMIKWSEEIRGQDPGYFCKLACENVEHKCPIWIVSDVRRKTDVEWFKEKFGDKIHTVRINADDGVRQQRGFTYTQGIDDVASECDLDNYEGWDYTFNNNGPEDAKKIVSSICQITKLF